MQRLILIVGSVPLAAPWNGADKVLAATLVRRDTGNRYIVQTDDTEVWEHGARVRLHRERRASAMPSRGGSLRAMAFLARHSHAADVVHIVASVRRPSLSTTAALRAWTSIARRPVIHTAPSLGDPRHGELPRIADVYVVFSEHSRQRLARRGHRHVLRMHPPLDFAQLRSRTPAEELRARLGLGTLPVLCATHVGEQSGVRELIAAFARADGLPATATLVLALRHYPWQSGERERARVREYAAAEGIADRVRLVERVEDMPALIAACAFTVLVPLAPSAKMDLPLVVLESLALGRPAIVGDRPPLSEALLGDAGIRVAPGDVEALAAALSTLGGSAEARHRLGCAGRAAAEQLCDPARAVAGFQAAYDLAQHVRAVAR